ncbi:MAG: MerR family transcriptional regulator [Clostridia bacterium]|nr:MerR family transcriptional regulator [Clostridia bacterium]
MTTEEACRRYVISPDTLRKYESNGLLTVSKNEKGENEYREEDFKRLGLIKVLLEAGFTFDETKKYLDLTRELGNDEAQIRMLRKQRRELLNDIRAKQKILDQLDFIIRERKTALI